MPNESSFRVALIVVILLAMAITVYHRFLAAKSGKSKPAGFWSNTTLRMILHDSNDPLRLIPCFWAYSPT